MPERETSILSATSRFYGGLYLSVFLANTIFWDFYVENLPCDSGLEMGYFEGLHCPDNSPLFYHAIATILNGCSPVSLPFFILSVPFSLIGFFKGHILLPLIPLYFMVSAASALSFLVFSFTFILNCIRNFSSKKFGFILITLILLTTPTLILSLYKSYLIPPSNSDQIIEIDLHSGLLKVPRRSLLDWSLFPPVHSRYDPNDTYVSYPFDRSTWGKNIPFALLKLDMRDVGAPISSNINVLIYPSQPAKNESLKSAENYLSYSLKNRTYQKFSVQMGTIYLVDGNGEKSNSPLYMKPQLLLMTRNEKSKEQALLSCRDKFSDFLIYRQAAIVTPSYPKCSSYIYRNRTQSPFHIAYEIHHEDLQNFWSIHQSIDNYVHNHISAKPKVSHP